jgi:hypothetical protein
MFIRYAFIVGLLTIFGHSNVAHANSCSNVDIIGSYDQSGIQENEFGTFAVGTFRIAEETDESKQPPSRQCSPNGSSAWEHASKTPFVHG